MNCKGWIAWIPFASSFSVDWPCRRCLINYQTASRVSSLFFFLFTWLLAIEMNQESIKYQPSQKEFQFRAPSSSKRRGPWWASVQYLEQFGFGPDWGLRDNFKNGHLIIYCFIWSTIWIFNSFFYNSIWVLILIWFI